MPRHRLAVVLLLMLVLAAGRGLAADVAPGGAVWVARIDGAIGPASADYVHRALQRAEQANAAAFVLELDTPGGLDGRIGYVAPSGARAASAGTYILYACHVAAMAPGTNLGAATPVAIGLGGPEHASAPASGAAEPADAMSAKRTHDAAAYIRSLAQLRGRNADWAERAVREAVSLAASEALAEHVVDLVAADRAELLRAVDGRQVALGDGHRVTLATTGTAVVNVEPDWRDRALAALSNPSIALVLMMIGVYGLLFEFTSPGFVLPGVVGALCLLLGVFGLQMLPINLVGLALVLLGIVFFVAEAFVPSYGALGIGGVAAFAFGALLLIDTEVPGFGVPLSLIAALALASLVFVVGVVGMAARARRRPVVAGASAMLGATGEVIEVGARQTWALVRGERWQVRASGHALRPGQRVRVTRIDGLTLEAVPVDGGNSP